MEDNQEISLVWPEFNHQRSSLVDHNRTQDQIEELDQQTWGVAPAVKFLLCLLFLIASNISCFALVSFFLTTLPTKRNLLIFFDILLVLALTCVVDIAVRIPFLLSGGTREKHFAESQFTDVIFSALLLFPILSFL